MRVRHTYVRLVCPPPDTTAPWSTPARRLSATHVQISLAVDGSAISTRGERTTAPKTSTKAGESNVPVHVGYMMVIDIYTENCHICTGVLQF